MELLDETNEKKQTPLKKKSDSDIDIGTFALF